MPRPTPALPHGRASDPLTQESLDCLAELAGVTTAAGRANLRTALERDAGELLDLLQWEKAEPSLAAEKVILLRLGKACGDLKKELKSLPSGVRMHLLMRVSQEGECGEALRRGEIPKHEPDGFESIRGPLAQLEGDIAYIMTPHHEGVETRGRPRLHSLETVAWHFGSIFKTFFDGSKAKLGGRREPPRDFKRECGLAFVHEAFRALLPPEYHPSEKALRQMKRIGIQ
jgi:hypothetical protein